MTFPTVSELKEHLNLTVTETDFDAELPRHLEAAQERVIAYLNRNVYESLPTEPEETDIELNASISRAIIEVGGYFLTQKARLMLIH